MSTFTFEGKEIFYRTVGNGEPLLIMNGIMIVITSYSIHYTKLYELPPPFDGIAFRPCNLIREGGGRRRGFYPGGLIRLFTDIKTKIVSGVEKWKVYRYGKDYK